MAAWSALAAAVLLLIGLTLAWFAGSTWTQLQRHQAEELARLRQEVTELRKQSPGFTAADPIPRIGHPTPVFQIGDHIEVTEGPHRGDHGTIVPSPDWLKPGYVTIDLTRSQTRVYMSTSRLAPLDT